MSSLKDRTNTSASLDICSNGPEHQEVDQPRAKSMIPSEQDEDEPEVEEFIRKYGDIKVSYIDPPKLNRWFTKPYALNYFHDGKLFRTKHERTSGKLELFLDLVYVGIAANLASSAVSKHTGLSFLKYLFVFIPAWTIWSDLKDFMNYYFNDDLLQRLFVLWELILLVVYDNNCEYIEELDNITPILTCVVCYFLARFTIGSMWIFYSLYIPEHRIQMRLYGGALLILSSCWFFILLIPNNWGRCIFAAIWFVLEMCIYIMSFAPWIKKKLNLKHSTALNIEHEAERYTGFYIIAIGEFLYSLNAGSPFAKGWNTLLAKGISVLIDGFIFMGFYDHNDGSYKATHALRRSATTAIVFIYMHFFLIASLLIVGDAGVDLAKLEEKYLPEEEFGVLMYFHSGILVALTSLFIIAMCDKDRTPPGLQFVSKYYRIGARIPVGCLCLGMTWAYELLTIVKIMWLDCLFLILLYAYEFSVMNPFTTCKNHSTGIMTV